MERGAGPEILDPSFAKIARGRTDEFLLRFAPRNRATQVWTDRREERVRRHPSSAKYKLLFPKRFFASHHAVQP